MPTDATEQLVEIPADGVRLEGKLAVPADPSGLVAFAHGSGSSRHSPRNNFVADELVDRGLATLLFDLLTEEEDRDYETRFDVDRLVERLLAATDWIEGRADVGTLPLGYFGSSTGAAAALRAAAARWEEVSAVVSRGGRVDLASDALPDVTAATLFVVGGDTQVLQLNREAFERLTCETELSVVENAGHLFEEPGALEEVADLAGEWFVEYLQ
jgi:pimeloyl-ACP methyl ester carboxylesterase